MHGAAAVTSGIQDAVPHLTSGRAAAPPPAPHR